MPSPLGPCSYPAGPLRRGDMARSFASGRLRVRTACRVPGAIRKAEPLGYVRLVGSLHASPPAAAERRDVPVTTSKNRGPRTMTSYLALPRPGDLGKVIILPLGFAVGSVLTSGPGTHQLLRAALVWFAVE